MITEDNNKEIESIEDLIRVCEELRMDRGEKGYIREN